METIIVIVYLFGSDYLDNKNSMETITLLFSFSILLPPLFLTIIISLLSPLFFLTINDSFFPWNPFLLSHHYYHVTPVCFHFLYSNSRISAFIQFQIKRTITTIFPNSKLLFQFQMKLSNKYLQRADVVLFDSCFLSIAFVSNKQCRLMARNGPLVERQITFSRLLMERVVTGFIIMDHQQVTCGSLAGHNSGTNILLCLLFLSSIPLLSPQLFYG